MFVYPRILQAHGDLEVPDFFEPDLVDLLQKLLEVKVSDRLGTSVPVRSHQYFSQVRYWTSSF